MTLIKHTIFLKIKNPRLCYSTNATLESTIQLRKKLYVSSLPLQNQIQTNTFKSETDITQMDDLKILKLLSGKDTSNGITIDNPLFSVLLNKCLSNARKNKELRTVQSIESFYHIFERYKHEANTNGLYYYDLNNLCRYFIDCKQLGKSQKILHFLFKRNLNKINNSLFLSNYLNARSGSDFRLWNSKKYKIFDYMIVSQLINDFNKFKYLSVPIINSLGYMKNIQSLGQYINLIWGVTLLRHNNNNESDKPENESNIITSTHLNENNILYPTEDLLLSIMLSYYYNDKTMVRSFKMFELFLKKYPNIRVTPTFWFNLISNCLSLTTNNGKNDDTSIKMIWNAMKLWFSDQNIPFNEKVLYMMYIHLKSNNNLYYINDIYERCIGPYSLLKRTSIPKQIKDMILVYQKYIIRKNIDKMRFRRSQNFIDKWSFSLENKSELLEFYQMRSTIRKKRNNKLRNMDEDDEDQYGIFGSFW